ncbi:TetR/AcrR family transcriptional regulator C-terminal domain-containing protein [uncultured Jatrophihabitans sp.]|uniref:TetR/AcrR family transcriptional regulator C-terminal domain-containing protein n=1 Tax=uncultured Jatrophihabitans sp. TaxID=1610747 RepID=UPI0035C979D2
MSRDEIVEHALDLLDEVGLDHVSTRALALRLDVKQPSLYWHFKNKDALLVAMATAAMAPHANLALPSPLDDWRTWFTRNTESFRRTLLMRRDGARLHAGSRPAGTALDRTTAKIDFLVSAGLPRRPAEMAMLAASRFTVGSVLEQQADQHAPTDHPELRIDHDEAFRSGLTLMIQGLAEHQPTNRSHHPTARSRRNSQEPSRHGR